MDTHHWINPNCISQSQYHFCIMRFSNNFVMNKSSYLKNTSFSKVLSSLLWGQGDSSKGWGMYVAHRIPEFDPWHSIVLVEHQQWTGSLALAWSWE